MQKKNVKFKKYIRSATNTMKLVKGAGLVC